MAVVRVFIHRHTGGLEKKIGEKFAYEQIHRHTGGLENKLSKLLG